jgi:hypothetical protein
MGGSRLLHPIFICQQLVTDRITILLQFDDIRETSFSKNDAIIITGEGRL